MTEFQKYIQRYLDQIPSDNWLEEMINSGQKPFRFFWFRQRKSLLHTQKENGRSRNYFFI